MSVSVSVTIAQQGQSKTLGLTSLRESSSSSQSLIQFGLDWTGRVVGGPDFTDLNDARFGWTPMYFGITEITATLRGGVDLLMEGVCLRAYGLYHTGVRDEVYKLYEMPLAIDNKTPFGFNCKSHNRPDSDRDIIVEQGAVAQDPTWRTTLTGQLFRSTLLMKSTKSNYTSAHLDIWQRRTTFKETAHPWRTGFGSWHYPNDANHPDLWGVECWVKVKGLPWRKSAFDVPFIPETVKFKLDVYYYPYSYLDEDAKKANSFAKYLKEKGVRSNEDQVIASWFPSRIWGQFADFVGQGVYPAQFRFPELENSPYAIPSE